MAVSKLLQHKKYYVEFVICKKDSTWETKRYSVPEHVFTGSHGDALDYCAHKLMKFVDAPHIFVNDYYMKSVKMGISKVLPGKYERAERGY